MKRNECIDVIKFILVSMIIVLHTIQMSCYGNYFLLYQVIIFEKL